MFLPFLSLLRRHPSLALRSSVILFQPRHSPWSRLTLVRATPLGTATFLILCRIGRMMRRERHCYILQNLDSPQIPKPRPSLATKAIVRSHNSSPTAMLLPSETRPSSPPRPIINAIGDRGRGEGQPDMISPSQCLSHLLPSSQARSRGTVYHQHLVIAIIPAATRPCALFMSQALIDAQCHNNKYKHLASITIIKPDSPSRQISYYDRHSLRFEMALKYCLWDVTK